MVLMRVPTALPLYGVLSHWEGCCSINTYLHFCFVQLTRFQSKIIFVQLNGFSSLFSFK